MKVLSRGEAISPNRDELPEIARRNVRYADPASWVVATAVARTIKGCAIDIGTIKDETGLISISATGPSETMLAVSQATKDGYSSALRFPAASPSTVAGVSCVAFGLKGPTLNLTMQCAEGVTVSLHLIEYWLQHRGVPNVFLATSCEAAQFGVRARCALFGLPSTAFDSPVYSVDDTALWLSL